MIRDRIKANLLANGAKQLTSKSDRYWLFEHVFYAPNGELIKRYIFLGKHGSIRYNTKPSCTDSIVCPNWYLKQFNINGV